MSVDTDHITRYFQHEESAELVHLIHRLVMKAPLNKHEGILRDLRNGYRRIEDVDFANVIQSLVLALDEARMDRLRDETLE